MAEHEVADGRERWSSVLPDAGNAQGPETVPPEAPGGAPEPPWLQAVRAIAQFVFHRYLFAWGALLLVFALGALTSAWSLLSARDEAVLGRLTGLGSVKLLDSAVEICLQSGPGVALDPDHALWQREYRLEYLLELDHVPGHPTARYRSQPSRDLADSPFWPALARQPVFRTPRLAIQMDKGLHRLLTSTPARTGVAFRAPDPHGDGSPGQRGDFGSQFDQDWVSFDMPMHAAAIEWWSASREQEVPVRYDPRRPREFLFEKALAAATAGRNRGLSIAGGLLIAALGLFVLIFAVSALTAGTMSVWVPRVLFCVVLAAVPFATPYLQGAVGYLGVPELPRLFLQEWARSTDPRVRAGFMEEMSPAQQAGRISLPIDVAHSRHKDVFAFFDVSPGGRSYRSFDEAMTSISAQISARLVSMPADDLFRFFKILDEHVGQRREGWDEPFLEGVRNVALDTTRLPSLRSWAISALCGMASTAKDPKLPEFLYEQYAASEPDVRDYWRGFFSDYAKAPSFAGDLRSSDPARVRRAMELWVRHGDFLDEVRPLVPRLKQLTAHPDAGIRELALEKWQSRADWEE